jgi:hypothetical protein
MRLTWFESFMKQSLPGTARRSRCGWRRRCTGRLERGPRWRRRRPGCSGVEDATASLLLIGRKLPTVRPRSFQAAGDRVLVGLWANTMEGRPTRWWTVLTVRSERVAAIEDFTRHRDAVRVLEGRVAAAI